VIAKIVLQRPEREREPFCIRRTLTSATDKQDILDLMRWEGKCLEQGFADELLSAHISPGQGWGVYTRHVPQSGKLDTTEYVIFNRYPFESNIRCQLWLVMVASRAGSSTTGAQLYEWLRAKAPIPLDTFVQGVSALIGAGVLQTDLHARKNQ
jgi:hypothetical protein